MGRSVDLGTQCWWVAISFSLMLSCVERVSTQIKYSVPEEVKVGSVVGNVAKDLGLDISSLEKRRFRIVSGVPFLVLQKSLDREKESEHKLILTAIDGGNPPRSGTVNVTVIVLDSNDNHPTFSQEVYYATVRENTDAGVFVIKLNATDLDEGLNGQIEYFFGEELKGNLYEIFNMDKDTGELRINGEIDFEKTDIFKLDVHATDKGQPPMSADCTVIISVLDVNDNKPEIEVTSLSKIVSEDSKPGTVVALISITDQDAGLNGKVICSLSDNIPFDLKPSFQDNMYSLVIKHKLDRESVSHYDVTITATDCGVPPLSTSRTLSIDVSDVNDNAPQFAQNPVELYLVAGSSPGLDSLGRCVFGQDTLLVAYWWWSEGPVAPVSGSLASVSAPQGGCGYNVACHHQCVNVCVNGWMTGCVKRFGALRD
uniref:Cadherin domain-containing protein n=1 Tax=Maylandia zebra TaxID=106582 RepID=A0A3P9ASZ6_9CICH